MLAKVELCYVYSGFKRLFCVFWVFEAFFCHFIVLLGAQFFSLNLFLFLRKLCIFGVSPFKTKGCQKKGRLAYTLGKGVFEVSTSLVCSPKTTMKIVFSGHRNFRNFPNCAMFSQNHYF